jgi:hypothetical protein
VADDLGVEEVEVAKEGLLRGLHMDIESPAALCSLDVGEVLERGRRFDAAAAQLELEQVTAARVRALAAEILRADRMASAVCGPEGAVTRVA